MVKYKEIKGGSVLSQIRQYNNRDDCFYVGGHKLVYPRPYGEGCGEFLNVCNYAFRVPENQFCPYRPEEVLSYEPLITDAAMYGKKAFKGNSLNSHSLQLVDFLIKGNTAKLEYIVDANAEDYQTLVLPFLYIPLMQFVLNIGVGSTNYQKMVLALSKNGALIYEIAETTVFTRYDNPIKSGD